MLLRGSEDSKKDTKDTKNLKETEKDEDEKNEEDTTGTRQGHGTGRLGCSVMWFRYHFDVINNFDAMAMAWEFSTLWVLGKGHSMS